jgi:hypothetical protein
VSSAGGLPGAVEVEVEVDGGTSDPETETGGFEAIVPGALVGGCGWLEGPCVAGMMLAGGEARGGLCSGAGKGAEAGCTGGALGIEPLAGAEGIATGAAAGIAPELACPLLGPAINRG